MYVKGAATIFFLGIILSLISAVIIFVWVTDKAIVMYRLHCKKCHARTDATITEPSEDLDSIVIGRNDSTSAAKELHK